MTRYELLERIGAGGMAEIFRGKAVAAGGFEKPVAIKRILPHLSQDQRFVQLLIAEAKILSQLRHRNIVQIFDVGLGDDGQYFLVMEFVDGRDLGAIQRGLEGRRKRLPLDLVLHIGAEICEALQHAHSAPQPDGKPMRLVHRDVSPSNVLISRAGEVKLTDFGIAKRPEEQTGQHGVRGKFAYISPEQAENRHVDARSDVFSVGVLLYELALGHRLFSQLADFDALRAVRECKIPRPSEIDTELPREVEEILLAALAKDPDRRTTSAGEMGSKLRGVRYSLETTAGDPATELARIVANLEQALRESKPAKEKPAGKRRRPISTAGFEIGEPTVVRITTADGFTSPDGDPSAILRARQVLDRFEEEETRLGRGRNRDPFPSEELTIADPPSVAAALDLSDSGSIQHDEETRVMGPAALLRKVAPIDDDPTETVSAKRRPRGGPVAIGASVVTSAPPPIPAPPQTPSTALRPTGLGPAASPTSVASARTPLRSMSEAADTGPLSAPVAVAAAASSGAAPRVDATTGSRSAAPARPSGAGVSGPASAATGERRDASAPVSLPPVTVPLRPSRRRWLLAIAAAAVAVGSFFAASAVLGDHEAARGPDAAAPVAVPPPVDAAPPPPDAAVLDAGAAVPAREAKPPSKAKPKPKATPPKSSGKGGKGKKPGKRGR